MSHFHGLSIEPAAVSVDERLRQFRDGVAHDLSLLALLHNQEPESEQLTRLRSSTPNECWCTPVRSPPRAQAQQAWHEALQAMEIPIGDACLTRLWADFSGIYIMHTFRASPEESVWFSEEGCTRQESMFQVRAWYKRHGLEAQDWRTMADDHLVVQLQFIAYLFEQTSEATLSEAAQFMDEHLLRWIDRFAQRVCARCESAYFAALASLTGTYLHELRENLAELLGKPIPSQEEIESKMQPSSRWVEKPIHFVPGVAPTW